MLKKFHLILSAFTLIGVFFCSNVKAQYSLNYNNNTTLLNKMQDTLKSISESSFKAATDEDRIKFNSLFVKKLVNALKTPYSYNYKFDSLKNISILRSPDNAFRIITWFVPTIEGNYRYYGSIQIPTANGQLKLIPLNDYTENFTDVNAITNSKKWFGARYYELIPVTSYGKQPYYLLLGWKGNNQKTTKKVIEVLSFDKDEVVFGRNIFETENKGPVKNRMVFEYNKLNTMTLMFDKRVNMIVFDHLAPYDPKMTDNYEFYGSDLSFDGYAINYAKLRLKEDVELKNDPTELDDLYVPPVKATTLLKSN